MEHHPHPCPVCEHEIENHIACFSHLFDHWSKGENSPEAMEWRKRDREIAEEGFRNATRAVVELTETQEDQR